MGKPLITTDMPGCREMVEEGKNGFFCAIRDPASLAQAMRRMIDLPAAERQRMGLASRSKVEATYDERFVIDHYLAAIKALPDRQPSLAVR